MTPDCKVCEVCGMSHQGRCTPPLKRSVSICITLPTHIHTRLAEQVPWGERSGWVAGLIARELEKVTS